MEAARPLHVPERPVELLNGAVVIRDLVVEDRTLVELVERRLEQKVAAEETVANALEIGARVLDREATAAEVDFVKREFERASTEVERSFADQAREVAEKLEERLEHFLGEDQGAIGRALEAHSDTLSELTARHFGPDRSTAVQHQLREVLAKALQDQRADLLKVFSSQDGHNPLADFKATVRREIELSREKHGALLEKLGSLEAEIKVLHEAHRGEDALAAERERGTGKGRSFEQRAYELVEEMTTARGDAAHHVGDERSASGGKKGDIVIELDAGSGRSKGRIALDAKDEKLSKNEAWKVLNASLEEREASFAILVVASDEKVPSGREPLHEYEGNKMIVTLDKESFDARPLELAYRYARCRALMAHEGQLEVDGPAVRYAAQEALSALKDSQRVRGSLTGATTSVEAARTALDGMVGRVEASLQRIEEMISDH